MNLLSGECVIVLVCGVNVFVDLVGFVVFSKVGMLFEMGIILIFDLCVNGYV